MGVLSANAGDEEFNKIAEQELDGSIAGGESPVLVPPISTDERQQRKWQHSQWGVVFSEDAVEETGPQLFLDQSQFSHPELHAKPAATYAATNSTDSPDIAGSTAAGASSFAGEKDSFTVDGSYGYEDIPLTTPGAADADSSRASYREHNPVEDNTSSYGYDLAANIDDDDDDDEDDGAFTLTSNLDT